MVSFDHRAPGTPENDWALSASWMGVARYEPGVVNRVLVISAHPDDETLGAGGLVSRLAREGATVSVLVATRGEAASAGADRMRELADAVRLLAPGSAITDLGLPDGSLRENAGALTKEITDAAAGADLLIAPWRGDGHRDHRIAGEAAAIAAEQLGIELLEYPVWLWHWADPGETDVPWDDFVRVRLDAQDRAAKESALGEYASQTKGADPIIHSGMLAHFERDWETFVRTPA